MLPNIFTAIDTNDYNQAKKFLQNLPPEFTGVKIGKELFTAHGPKIVELAKFHNFKVFLDLKFHDIPNTVNKACIVASNLGVDLLTVHSQGGPDMLKAAVSGTQKTQTKILAVTILTSIDSTQLKKLGNMEPIAELVKRYAKLSYESGCAGVIASAQEAAKIRQSTADNFLIVTPGIRLTNNSNDDQARVTTPVDAIRQGSDILVIGRPITQSATPHKKVIEISESIQSLFS